MTTNPKKEEATPPESPAPVTSIQKPPAFSLDRFRASARLRSPASTISSMSCRTVVLAK
jgi:hypothetical protein